MKSKKAVTLLSRAEALLCDVLDEYSIIEKQVEKNVRSVLLSAQESVSSAMNFIGALPGVQIPVRRRAKAKTIAKKRTRAKRSVRAKKASTAGKRR